jgi:hypothetical protein
VGTKISRWPYMSLMNIAQVTPCTVVSDMNIVHVDALIGENRQISVDTAAIMLNFRVGSAHGIIHETLKYCCILGGC